MLAAEAGLFVLLSSVFSSSRSAPQLRQGVLRAVIGGRMQARTVASAAAKAQIEAAGIAVAGELAPATAYEVARATAVASSAAELWATHRADAIAEGLDEAAAVAQAGKRSAWKASQLATTEVAETWSHETNRVVTGAVRQGVALWKVWDSVLDRGTCLVCASAHGTAVPAGTPFPEGEPGAVHPCCRCQAVIVTREQVDPVVAQRGASGREAFEVHDEPPKSGPRVIPGRLPEPEPKRQPMRLVRPRKVDAIPLPGTPEAARRTKPATFRPGRPPTKPEVTARKRAQRIAALGVRP